jgi:hypothetical protein
MRLELGEEAAEFGRQALLALETTGGDRLAGPGAAGGAGPDAVGQAGTGGAGRAGPGAEVEAVLEALGAWDLDPRADGDELEAAAALCRAVGHRGIAHPVAGRLARPRGEGGRPWSPVVGGPAVDGLVVIPAGPAAAVGGTGLHWMAVDLDGNRSIARPRPGAGPGTLSGVVALDLEPIAAHGSPDGAGTGTAATLDVALGLVLPCWTLLGMLDRALLLTREHVVQRQQFGRPLSSFQGVQFQLTDAEVERAGADVLARHALWSIQTRRDDAVADALAFRLAAVEAAEVVFRVAHQLHGAIGFCDESPLSWLSRLSQPVRRLPFGAATTRDALASTVGRTGLAGLFDGAEAART